MSKGDIFLISEKIDLINLTYDIVFVIDKSGKIQFANLAAEQNLFYTQEEFLEMNISDVMFEAEKFVEILDRIIMQAENGNVSDESMNEGNLVDIKENMGLQDLVLISKDTCLKIMMVNFQARKLIDNGEEYFLLILRDITKRKFFEQELFKITENLERLVEEKTQELQKQNEILEQLATRDVLTNLLNIRKFREILTSQIENYNSREDRDNGKFLSVMMIDADHFKYYNDTFGHQIGDEVIKGIGRLLTASVKRTDFVARYGGDEFIILFPEITYDESIQACLRVKNAITEKLRIKEVIHEILGIENVEIPKEHEITLSIGLSRYKTGVTMDDLINQADTALYASKEGGRNCIHVIERDGSCVRIEPDQYVQPE